MRELPEDRPPTDAELSALLADYVLIDETHPDLKDLRKYAYVEVDLLVHHDPETTWRLVKIACDAALPDDRAAFFAAGPVEDLLGLHGDVAWPWVEEEARRNAGLRRLLALVWRGAMSDDVWRRFEALRAKLAIIPQ